MINPKSLEKYGHIVSYPKNTTLFLEGDACSGMLLVNSGSIKVIKYSEDGKEALLYRVTPESLCILSISCLIGNNAYNAVGIAEEELQGIFIPHAQFMELLNLDPKFREWIFSSLALRISDFIQKLDDIIFKTLKERLIAFINRESLNSSDKIIHKTHQEMAIELGTGREVISRLLKSLEKEKLIDLSRNALKKL